MKMGKGRRDRQMLLARGIIFILVASCFSFLAVDYLQGETASCPTATIIGRVYDAASGRPIGRATARITAAGFDRSGTTDSAGMYSIADVPRDRELKLTCKKTGYRLYSAALPVLNEVTSYAYYTYDIPLTGLAAGAIGYEEKQPEASYGVEEAETGEEGKKYISAEEEYAPGIKTEEYKERKAAVESQAYPLREGAAPQADMALLSFTIDGQDVTDNLMLPQGNGHHNVIMNCGNAGPDAVRGCSIILLVDGELAVFERIDPFRAAANWDFNRFLHFEAGRHQVVGVIRSSSEYAEINGENNVIRGVVTFEGAEPPPADLRQTDLSVLIISVDDRQCRAVGAAPIAEIPLGDGGHRVCMMIRNEGRIDADAGAQLSIDGAIVSRFVEGDHLVPGGRDLTLCEDFMFEGGIHTLTGTVNPPLDSDDTNNSLSCSVDFTGVVEEEEGAEGGDIGDEGGVVGDDGGDIGDDGEVVEDDGGDIGDEGVVVGDDGGDIGDEGVVVGDEGGDRPPVVVQPPEEPVPGQPPAGQLPVGEPPVQGPVVVPQPGAQPPAEGIIPPRQLPVGQPQAPRPVYAGGPETVDKILKEEDELTEEEPKVVAAKEYNEPLTKAPLLKWLLLILLLLHISLAIPLQMTAKKTSTPLGWLAWIPIANLYLAYKIAGKRRKG